jgi:hypothetical protein
MPLEASWRTLMPQNSASTGRGGSRNHFHICSRAESALARAGSNEVRQGWNLQSQTVYQAVMIQRAKKVNHILHVLLSILTAAAANVEVWEVPLTLHGEPSV